MSGFNTLPYNRACRNCSVNSNRFRKEFLETGCVCVCPHPPLLRRSLTNDRWLIHGNALRFEVLANAG